MQAIILAGGFGTRLKSLSLDTPKPMVNINNKPFLSYILDELNNYGFSKVILAVGYKKDIIINHFKNKYKNINIEYSIENEPLGTGGALKKALMKVQDNYVFILNGDTLFKIDYNEMAKLNTISIACKELKYFDRYGEVKIIQNQIISFNEKRYVDKGYINGGIYYLPKNIFSSYNLPTIFSFENDFLHKYIKDLKITPYISNEYFIDIGIPEDYYKASSDLSKNKALFLDRDGIINIDYGHVHKIEDFKFTDFIFKLCKKYQSLGYLIIVITNQAGIGKGLYTIEDYNLLTSYMLKQLKINNINISKVYYCPHCPSVNCSCRKPNPGLFLQAIKEFNLNPEECIMVGDKLTDLEAAYKAGIKKLFYKKNNYEEYPVDFNYKDLTLR